MAITGHKRLRRDPRLESQLPGRCAVWRILQVRRPVFLSLAVVLILFQITALR